MRVEIVSYVTAETLFRLAIKKVKRGSIIYTEIYKKYDRLVSMGLKHERITTVKCLVMGRFLELCQGVITETSWGIKG
ncbi:MAG: transposase [Brevinematia bacterium]